MSAKLPAFADLPLNSEHPFKSAWGLYVIHCQPSHCSKVREPNLLTRRYGKDDQLGFLNRLTDEVVLDAAKEIKVGTRYHPISFLKLFINQDILIKSSRVSLNWPLDAQGALPFFGRQVFHQNLYAKPPRCVNDDVWTFNTQSSSQWDGLRHFAYQKERLFYNGVTMEDIHSPNCRNVNGIGGKWSVPYANSRRDSSGF